jgi:large subunit ribosomal protein L17
MRHRKKKKTLDRKKSQREALIRNQVNDFFLKKRIRTTLSKAKVTRSLAEKLITISKHNNLSARRKLLGYISEQAMKTAINELGPKYKERRGGYTRIIKLNRRQGDRAQIVILEFV